MTQILTMNATHKKQDTAFLIEKIRLYMRREAEKLIKELDSPNFAANYLGEPGTPTADLILKFGKDTNEILLQGRTFLLTKMVTPADADAAFAYLEGKGVFNP